MPQKKRDAATMTKKTKPTKGYGKKRPPKKRK